MENHKLLLTAPLVVSWDFGDLGPGNPMNGIVGRQIVTDENRFDLTKEHNVRSEPDFSNQLAIEMNGQIVDSGRALSGASMETGVADLIGILVDGNRAAVADGVGHPIVDVGDTATEGFRVAYEIQGRPACITFVDLGVGDTRRDNQRMAADHGRRAARHKVDQIA